MLPDIAAAPRPLSKRNVTPRGKERHIREQGGELHRVVVRILDQVGGKQHDGLVAGILRFRHTFRGPEDSDSLNFRSVSSRALAATPAAACDGSPR